MAPPERCDANSPLNLDRCQWYAMPVTSQAYRLGSLVATMAMELGINQRPMSVTQHDMIVSGNTGFAQTNEVTSSKFWSYETRRVFIGAYIISTLYCSPSLAMIESC